MTGVEITLSDGVLGLKLDERANNYVWCDGNHVCYYMDVNGFIFSTAPDFVGDVFLRFTGGMDGDPVGKNLLPKEDMRQIGNLINELAELGFGVKGVDIISRDEIHLVLKSGTAIYISLERETDTVSRNLRILLASKDFIDATGGIDKLDYIDMRFGKKAFWKARQVALPQG